MHLTKYVFLKVCQKNKVEIIYFECLLKNFELVWACSKLYV